MKIHITRGIYGFVKNGNVVEKTKDDPPFEVDDEEGRRLISLNVAESVNIVDKTADPVMETGMAKTRDDGDVSDLFSIEAMENRRKEELCRLAEEFGIKKNGSKTELAERIHKYVQTHVDEVLDNADDELFDTDEVPELTAEDPE